MTEQDEILRDYRHARGLVEDEGRGVAFMSYDELPPRPYHFELHEDGTLIQNVAIGESRTFDTGATRDTEEGKLDYEGFLSPQVLRRYAEYMHENRVQSDGTLRDADNWQKGIPYDVYMKSMWRHFMDVWMTHRMGALDAEAEVALEESLCALLFNVQGYLFEMMRGRS